MSGQPPVIVLVRPQLGQNIGKAARAMLNFGLTEMRLVAPRDGWPNPEAGPAASGADIVLEWRQRVRNHRRGDRRLQPGLRLDRPPPRPGHAGRRPGGDGARDPCRPRAASAILFGPERSGLETEDVALASRIVTVPINPEFGSLNLAQAVILLAYEWSRGAELAQPTAKELEPPAAMAELEGLIGQLDDALERAGYFYPPDRTPSTKATHPHHS